jgi:alkylation response protein AidB-like acyl-CoA dehydrogenase
VEADNSETDLLRREILATVEKFIKDELVPRAAEIDRDDVYPLDLHKIASELGLFAIAIPKAYGGLGLDFTTRLAIIERVARVSASFAVILSTWPDAALPIVELGSDALRAELLPKIASGEYYPAFALSEPGAGSDAAAMTTRAVRVDGGYRLSGTKTWCTHGGLADVVVVFATTDPSIGSRGITAFLVRKGTAGFRVIRDENLMGLRGSPQSTLSFDECFVPVAERLGEEGEGFRKAMESLDEARLNVSAKALGCAYACISLAVDYAKQREAFGQPIIRHQGLQFLLSELCTEYEAGRSRRASVIGSMAKNACTAIGMRAPVEAMQVFGAAGLSMDLPLQRFLRDAKAFQIYDGTTQIHNMIIGRYLDREGVPFE